MRLPVIAILLLSPEFAPLDGVLSVAGQTKKAPTLSRVPAAEQRTKTRGSVLTSSANPDANKPREDLRQRASDDPRRDSPRDPGGGSRSDGGPGWGTTAGIAGGAAIGGILLGNALSGGKEDVPKQLSKEGPQFPPTFAMNAVTVLGFARGNWPLVLDYETFGPGLYLVSVTAGGVEPYVYRLSPAAGGRDLIKIELPARFGMSPIPATFTIRAATEGPGELQPVNFRVYGFGAGPRAVGSVAIDQVKFGPAHVQPRKQDALYGFRARNPFTKMSAEFLRVEASSGGIVASVQDQDEIDVKKVRPNTVTDNLKWKDAKKARPGRHIVQIRAWYGLEGGADWVVAWSDDVVSIDER
jgi:hypothetical protein